VRLHMMEHFGRWIRSRLTKVSWYVQHQSSH